MDAAQMGVNVTNGIINRYGEKYLNGEHFSFSQVKALMIPVFLEQVSLSMITLLNGILISGAGDEAFAAVGVVDVLNSFMMNIFIAIASGGTVVVAQYMGRGDMEKVENSVVQAIKTATLIATGIALFIALFHRPIINVLYGSLDPIVKKNVIFYIFGSCLSYPISGFYNSSIAVLRGSGKTKISSKIIISVSLAHVTAGFLMIKVMNLGLWGVVLSMLVARVVGTILCYISVTRAFPGILPNLKQYIKKNKSIISSVFFIGIPAAVEQIFFNGGKLITQIFVVSMGTMMINANTISGQFYSLLFIPSMTISIGIVPIIGTCLGAGAKEEAQRFTKYLMRTSMITNAIVGIVLLPFLMPIIGLYTKVPEVQIMLRNIVIFAMVSNTLFLGNSYVQPAALRSAGDVRFVTMTSLTTMWTIRITLGYVLGVTLGWQVYGIWVAAVAEWIARGLVYNVRNKSGKWLNVSFLK